MKNALEKLWDTYPVKSEAIGEKSIEITVQSDGSNRTLSIPIGHVTRISFDRVKMGKDPGDTTIIVLPENINQTIRNISILRTNNITVTPTRELSTSGSGRSSSSLGNSFSSGNSFGPGLSASSGHSLDSSFPSSSGDNGGYPGNGLVAWGGNPDGTIPHPITQPDDYVGHNAFVYWAAYHLNYDYATTAANVAMEPDVWPQAILNPPIFGMTNPLKSIFADLIHCWTHYYNPDYADSLIEGYAPTDAKYFADISKANYSSTNYVDAAYNLGYASHFLTDVSNPMHTGQELNQVIDKLFTQHDTHAEYETFVSNNWSSTSTYKFGDLVKNNTYYYRVRSPDEATINTATFSHAYVDTLYYHVKNQPGTGFYSDPTVKNITENCVLIAARYTGGLVEYTRDNDMVEIPIADFEANPEIGSAPLTVYITERSHWYGAMPTWNWSFGDGQFSNDRYVWPDHIYQNNGIYNLTLTLSNANGQSSNKTVIISVGTLIPQADFNYATVGPSTIHFTDTSSNSPTSWVWDFGDGSNASVEQNATHQYSHGFFAHVRLYASNVYGATIREEEILVASPWPHADFIPSRISGSSPFIVQFIDNSTNYADNWTWDFGDNSPVSYERNTSHTYNNSGNYSVLLTASNSYGNTTSTNVISVIPPPLHKTGVYLPGTGFFLKMDNSSTWNSSTDVYLAWDNVAIDLPIAGDWNGDGRDETGVYRPGTGFFLKMDNSSTWNSSTDVYLAWDNVAIDLPIAGDWNGDGRDRPVYIDPVPDSISRWTIAARGIRRLMSIWRGIMEPTISQLPVTGIWMEEMRPECMDRVPDSS